MDSNSDVVNNSNNRIKFIAIGAGALVLALIAFSGLSWCAIVACGQRLASISVGYWELLGGSSLAVLAVLFIPPLRRRFLPRQLRSEPLSSVRDLSPGSATSKTTVSMTEDVQGGKWRELYNQLSNDEREEFKSLMKKYCADTPERGPSAEPE